MKGAPWRPMRVAPEMRLAFAAMTHAPAEIAIEYEVADAPVRQGLSTPRMRGIALLAPAVVGRRSCFRSSP